MAVWEEGDSVVSPAAALQPSAERMGLRPGWFLARLKPRPFWLWWPRGWAGAVALRAVPTSQNRDMGHPVAVDFRMVIRGHQLSKWWCLLLVPAVLFGLPAVLMLIFLGNDIAGIIVGPPAIWNRTSQFPSRPYLVGSYQGTYSGADEGSAVVSASLLLNADGSAEVSGLPYEFYPMTCTLSGNGTWARQIGDFDQKIDLRVTSDGKAGSFASGDYGSFMLAGHASPYKLYWVIGDPDSGTGLWMNRR